MRLLGWTNTLGGIQPPRNPSDRRFPQWQQKQQQQQ